MKCDESVKTVIKLPAVADRWRCSTDERTQQAERRRGSTELTLLDRLCSKALSEICANAQRSSKATKLKVTVESSCTVQSSIALRQNHDSADAQCESNERIFVLINQSTRSREPQRADDKERSDP